MSSSSSRRREHGVRGDRLPTVRDRLSVQIVIYKRKLRDKRVCHRRVGLLRRVGRRHRRAIRQSRLVLLVLLGGERVRHVEGVLLLLLLTRIAHDDDCKVGRVELEKRRGVETSVRSEARAVASSSVVEVMCALDSVAITIITLTCLFREKSATQMQGKKAKKRPKRNFFRLFSVRFFKIGAGFFAPPFEIIVVGVFLVHRSSKKRSSKRSHHQSPSSSLDTNRV